MLHNKNGGRHGAGGRTSEHRGATAGISFEPRGERPIAPCHHRFEWLYVAAFVSPATAESFWYLGTGVDKTLFEATLADLDAAVAAQCSALHQDRDLLRGQAGIHWWPQRVVPT